MVTLVQKLLPNPYVTMSQTTTVIAACIGVIFCVLSVAVLYRFFGTELEAPSVLPETMKK